MKTILIVDDERNMCQTLTILLENDGYRVKTASHGAEALDILRKNRLFDLVISDFKMPEMDGLTLLRTLREEGFQLPFIMITAYGTIESAVEAMKEGAVDFITKPFNKDLIRRVIRRVLKTDSLEQELEEIKRTTGFGEVVFTSPVMERVMAMVHKVGPFKTPVLLLGESGSGKGAVAMALHGDRKSPFVRINCPSLPENLFESELFGYQKGAFTGAQKDFKGKVRLAEGGTLFLDEIGEIPLSLQPKLLRLLEDRSFEPLGSNETFQVDTRIICATNQDLENLVRQGRFREDLFYRINTITITVPPLRDRPRDVDLLVDHFLGEFCRDYGVKSLDIDEAVRRCLRAHSWPGNVRELKNLVERTVVLSNWKRITLDDLPPELREKAPPESMDRLALQERKAIQSALEGSGGNISETARLLGISRNTLRYRMQKYGLSSGREEDDG